MKNKYVVTGGAGFIGSAIVSRLLNDGHKVVVVDDLSSGYESYLPKHKNLTFFKVDITNQKKLMSIVGKIKNFQTVFHLAGFSRIQPSIVEPENTYNTNVIGTLNVLQLMKAANIKSIVYSASSSSYGLRNSIPSKEDMSPDCLNPYAASKYAGELTCKAWGTTYGIKNVCLKYFNVYGERSPLELGGYSPVIGLFYKQALNGQAMTIVGDGEQKRDFTYVQDVVDANLAAANKLQEDNPECNGETLNVGTGRTYTINKVAQIVSKSLNFKVDVKYIPARPAECKITKAYTEKTKKMIGWSAKYSLEEACNDILCKHYKEYFQ